MPEDCPQAVADLIERCLAQDHQLRPTAAEVLRLIEESMSMGAAAGGPSQPAPPPGEVEIAVLGPRAAWEEADEGARLLHSRSHAS